LAVITLIATAMLPDRTRADLTLEFREPRFDRSRFGAATGEPIGPG
jgi:hypothetical protein